MHIANLSNSKPIKFFRQLLGSKGSLFYYKIRFPYDHSMHNGNEGEH